MLRIEAIGNIGKDATTNEVNGKNVINFSVAVTEKYKDQEKTTWLDCALWRDSTAVAQYLKKGTKVFIDGSPEIRSYAKADGTTGTSFTVRVNNLELLGGGKAADEAPAPKAAAKLTPQMDNNYVNDLPF